MVLARYRAELLTLPYVVGVALGKDEEGRPCILILLERELRPGEEIPEYLDHIRVITKVVGKVKPLVTAEIPLTEVRPYGVHQERYRPVVGGISTGHYAVTAGTLSCVITDRWGRKLFLSNNHVYADSNRAEIGDPMLQPGAFNGGIQPDDIIGTLLTFVPIGAHNIVDAAVALPTVDFEERIEGLDGMLDPVEAEVDMAIVGSGRTSGVTHGTITGIGVDIKVEYPGIGVVWFEDQLMIEPGEFAAPGDSGKLCLTEDLHPVGLIFAGSDAAAYANRFQNVLSEIERYLEEVPPPPRPIWPAILFGAAVLIPSVVVGIKVSR